MSIKLLNSRCISVIHIELIASESGALVPDTSGVECPLLGTWPKLDREETIALVDRFEREIEAATDGDCCGKSNLDISSIDMADKCLLDGSSKMLSARSSILRERFKNSIMVFSSLVLISAAMTGDSSKPSSTKSSLLLPKKVFATAAAPPLTCLWLKMRSVENNKQKLLKYLYLRHHSSLDKTLEITDV